MKVLDFGLAKAYEAEGTSSEMSPDLSASPTMAAATRTGVIMGTAAYMSPEQARGKPVDKRTDIWAFGCVVFEILTGKRAFQGETVTDILAAIVHQEPQWEALPPETPLRIREVLHRCLEKQTDERLRDVGECRVAVKEYLADPEGEKKRALASGGSVGVAGNPWKLAVAVGVVALLVGVVATWFAMRAPTVVRAPLADFVEPLPEGLDFINTNYRLVAFSPDGARIVFSANNQLWVRALGETEIAPVRGTEGEIGVVMPFFSPDGQSIAFFSDFELKRVAATGGPPQVLADVSDPQLFVFGASWAADGNLYAALGPGSGTTTIMRVSENGGQLEEVVNVESGFVRGPQLLPGGEWLLYTLADSIDAWWDAAIIIESLVTGVQRELFRGGTDARYLSSGHIVYANRDTLLARAFDVDRLEVSAAALPVREEVWSRDRGSGTAHWDTSNLGGLVYVPGIADEEGSVGLTWFSIDGKVEPLPLPPTQDKFLWVARVSPAGDRIAVVVEDARSTELSDRNAGAVPNLGPRWRMTARSSSTRWREERFNA